MGEVLEVAKVLVKPTMKLLDMVGGAIGTAYEPRRKRKMADATAYEISVVADAIRNAADMPVLYNQDGVTINSDDFSRLMQRAGTRLALQETIKQHNIERVIDNAYEILEKEDVCSAEPVEQGWINNFFDSIANVSDEDLQNLWGKILAGEISRPGSFSIRTLDLLRKITYYEANLFRKIVPYVLHGEDSSSYNQRTFYLLDDTLEKIPNLMFDDMVRMKAAGIISYDSITITCNLNPGEEEIFDNLDKKNIAEK